MNQIAKEWQDYEVIDTGNKEKLDLNTQDYSLNKPATGILWPIRSKNQSVMI